MDNNRYNPYITHYSCPLRFLSIYKVCIYTVTYCYNGIVTHYFHGVTYCYILLHTVTTVTK